MKNDVEISVALALAIGWADVWAACGGACWVANNHSQRIFDYRDWNVIGPIAEKFDAFPGKIKDEWDCYIPSKDFLATADTPQKAIALAVIAKAQQ